MIQPLVLSMILALSLGPARPQETPKAPPDFEAQARAVIADLAARHFDRVESQFDARMAQAISAEKLGQVWDAVLGMGGGSFQSIREVHVTEAQGRHVVSLSCDFSAAVIPATVAFDADGKLGGLLFGMPQSKAPWSPPDYARPDSFEEREVKVGHAPLELTGMLALPKTGGPFPAVVLVQGSGATDLDEAVGPNKPFKDLAWGLASRGIAVLRYNKRTFQYPTSFTGQFTVEQETLEDARAAVTLLTMRSEIDSKRIFVLGHSLGAMLAPRLAQSDPQVAGIIIMAGITRPLEDVVVEQVKYEVGLAGKSTPEGDKAIADAEKSAAEIRSPALRADQTVDLVGTKAPGSYFLDLRAYDPARTAASLKIPILVLQGERDCQVRLADFEGWKRALAGHPLASFRLYPNLYHLFLPVPASDQTPLSTPADYDQPGHVAPAVVADVAAWIEQGRLP